MYTIWRANLCHDAMLVFFSIVFPSPLSPFSLSLSSSFHFFPPSISSTTRLFSFSPRSSVRRTVRPKKKKKSIIHASEGISAKVISISVYNINNRAILFIGNSRADDFGETLPGEIDGKRRKDTEMRCPLFGERYGERYR